MDSQALLSASVLLCRLAELPSGEAWLLALPGGLDPERERGEAQVRRHEMGPKEVIRVSEGNIVFSPQRTRLFPSWPVA